MRSVGHPELIIIFVVLILPALAFWKIFSKAGYPGPLGLLMFIPGVNAIVVLFFAFSDWPVLRELRALRAARQ